ncbi:MAG: radical SAM protein, partial [Candidatus Cloacimonetes bacterium]|nr:radical SAM protein [Candidatus Cloacimonadota bacterium]
MKKQQMSSICVENGLQLKSVRFRLRMNIIRLALSVYRSPITSFQVLLSVIKKKRSIQGDNGNAKFAYANGRYFWTIASTGWPSKAFDKFILGELNKVKPYGGKEHILQTMIFSITSRCPLKCEHCYEWNNLSAKETLSLDDLSLIMRKFQDYGICNIQFSGGEPLTRFEDLLYLIKNADKDTEMWILTSGFGLTSEKAQLLQQAGLSGVVISLDHWDESKHNEFRKHKDSYKWAMEAAHNAHEADLVVAFSLCAGREFVSEDNLNRYMQLAKDSDVSIVRILEPRKTGHYEGQDIELNQEQIAILDRFYLKTMSDPLYKKMPILEYVGHHQRKIGCFGGGDRYLYVDSKADVHACPFCQGAVGNALTDPLTPLIERLKQIGCHKFDTK